jgi:hypothetical protein
MFQKSNRKERKKDFSLIHRQNFQWQIRHRTEVKPQSSLFFLANLFQYIRFAEKQD